MTTVLEMVTMTTVLEMVKEGMDATEENRSLLSLSSYLESTSSNLPDGLNSRHNAADNAISC